jgi:uncharacterized protein (DUF2267 family)
MSATGLDVFDKTLQTTNIWLDELMADIGPDRQVAWHVLGAVLRTIRDRVPGPLAAHLGAQLPLLVRGAFYDGYRPQSEPLSLRDQEAFWLMSARVCTTSARSTCGTRSVRCSTC